MEHLLDRGVRQQRPDRRQVRDGEGVDDGGALPRRELHEEDAVPIAVEARRFGISPDQRLAAERRDDLAERLGRPDIAMHEGVRSGSLFLAQLLQTGRDLLERLREGLVELGIRWFGSATQRIARALAGGARRVADVVGGNPHRGPRA